MFYLLTILQHQKGRCMNEHPRTEKQRQGDRFSRCCRCSGCCRARCVDEQLLVKKLRRGCRSSLCCLYAKYRPHLLRVACALLGQSAQGEDVVHDVFVDFVQSCERFELTGSLEKYLVACVANRARNTNRSRGRQLSLWARAAERRPVPQEPPEHGAIRDEESRRISGALRCLIAAGKKF